MSQHIKTQHFDAEKYLLDTLGLTHDGALVRNLKPAQTAPYRCVVIAARALGRVTPISRRVALTVSAWDVRSNHTANLAGAHNLAGSYAGAVENLAGAGPVVHAEIESGPYRVVDDESQTEYSVVNLLLEVSF